MRTKRGAAWVLVGVIACAFVAGASGSPSREASNSLQVRQVLLAKTVILKGSYYVERPQRCPAFEPSISGDAAWDAWYSNDCESYRYQEADFTVRVRHKGRLVYIEDTSESSFGQPHKGGKLEHRIYLWALETTASCSAGNYYWSVTMVDPYGRSAWNRSRKGGFTVSCR